MPVALLTGRVYQDGLGGLRAVLFIFGNVLSAPGRGIKSDTRSPTLHVRRASDHFRYERTISMSSSAARACSELIFCFRSMT